MRSLVWLLCGSLVSSLLLSGVHAWGKEGHYATCKIAEGLLTDDAAVAVKALLPDYANGELATVCSWPDEIRHNYQWRWTSPLHYIDTPDFECNYKYSRDCHDAYQIKDRCVAGAIFNYTGQLLDSKSSWSIERYNLTEALLFLSHFVGDIHQPLHVGFTGDEGGNTIHVRWYRRKSNLHHVWDDLILDSARKRFYDSDLSVMIKAIQRNIKENWTDVVSNWESCDSGAVVCPNVYASESISLACKYAYRHATPGSILSDEYFLSRHPIVEERLAQGGVRLAATLNRIFSPSISIIPHVHDSKLTHKE